MKQSLPISIAIPTYRREEVLVQTLKDLLDLPQAASEILLLDQTPQHTPSTDAALGELHAQGRIKWLRLPTPSIPQAMNRALLEATQPLVLFLDDDVRPESGLLAAHLQAHSEYGNVLVAGKVLQPWDEGKVYADQLPFHFASNRPGWIDHFMGGNFSIAREAALSLGGFDENFVRVAYRFEAEFAHRLRASGRRIRYEPGACLHHLKVSAGGTRSYGEHLTTWRPDHAVGAYYYSLRTRDWREFVQRPWRSLATRYHLRRPWRIPATLVAELSGMLWALRLFAAGPRTLPSPRPSKP